MKNDTLPSRKQQMRERQASVDKRADGLIEKILNNNMPSFNASALAVTAVNGTEPRYNNPMLYDSEGESESEWDNDTGDEDNNEVEMVGELLPKPAALVGNTHHTPSIEDQTARVGRRQKLCKIANDIKGIKNGVQEIKKGYELMDNELDYTFVEWERCVSNHNNTVVHCESKFSKDDPQTDNGMLGESLPLPAALHRNPDNCAHSTKKPKKKITLEEKYSRLKKQHKKLKKEIREIKEEVDGAVDVKRETLEKHAIAISSNRKKRSHNLNNENKVTDMGNKTLSRKEILKQKAISVEQRADVLKGKWNPGFMDEVKHNNRSVGISDPAINDVQEALLNKTFSNGVNISTGMSGNTAFDNKSRLSDGNTTSIGINNNAWSYVLYGGVVALVASGGAALSYLIYQKAPVIKKLFGQEKDTQEHIPMMHNPEYNDNDPFLRTNDNNTRERNSRVLPDESGEHIYAELNFRPLADYDPVPPPKPIYQNMQEDQEQKTNNANDLSISPTYQNLPQDMAAMHTGEQKPNNNANDLSINPDHQNLLQGITNIFTNVC